MGRPAIIDDAKLLEAARGVFLRKGAGATTAEVARRAGISQASIFKRYRTKQELFLAAMRAERERMGMFENLSARTAAVGLREALVEAGVEMLSFMDRMMPLILTTWSGRGTFGLPPWAAGKKAPFFRDAARVIDLIEAEMRAGRLRRQDPWLVLRIFIATIQHHALAACVFKRQPGPHLSPQEYMRGVVEVLWGGIGPPEPPVVPPRRSP
ncbi:MAG: TetR/AcrR family transcriptional regulator [Myxococcales bacterium]